MNLLKLAQNSKLSLSSAAVNASRQDQKIQIFSAPFRSSKKEEISTNYCSQEVMRA